MPNSNIEISYYYKVMTPKLEAGDEIDIPAESIAAVTATMEWARMARTVGIFTQPPLPRITYVPSGTAFGFGSALWGHLRMVRSR